MSDETNRDEIAALRAEVERLKDIVMERDEALLSSSLWESAARNSGKAFEESEARAEKAERERDEVLNDPGYNAVLKAKIDAEARAEKLAAALRKIEGDESGCIDGCCHHAFRATRLAARAIERVAELERMLNITAHAIAEIEGEKRD